MNKDVIIKIILNETIFYFSSIKTCGMLIWDINTGIFFNKQPILTDFFKFTKYTDWDGCINQIDVPFESIHGNLIIDFDKKNIIDNINYTNANIVSFQTFKKLINDACLKTPGFVSRESLIKHLENKRIYLKKDNKEIGLPKKVKDVNKYLDEIKGQYNWAVLILPKEWNFKKVKYEN